MAAVAASPANAPRTSSPTQMIMRVHLLTADAVSRPDSASSNRQPSEGKGTEQAGATIHVVDVSADETKPSTGESSFLSP